MNTFRILLTCGCIVSSAHADEDRRVFEVEREKKQISLWMNKLDESSNWSNDLKIDKLSTGLRNMGHRKSHPARSEDVDALYSRIQSLLLSIPGHARYFSKEIERGQKEVEGLPTNYGKRVGYDFMRSMHFRTLAHLPSPETIWILGRFLHDEKDTPVPEVSPNSDWGRNPRANCWGAVATIADIGLRAPPVTRHSGWDDDGSALAKCRSWWEEIESGKRAFSFLGQKVEYRFKPDGTWEATPLAISDETLRDELKPPVPPTSAAKAPPAGEPSPSPAPSPRWPWVAAGILVLMAVTAWALRKSKR